MGHGLLIFYNPLKSRKEKRVCLNRLVYLIFKDKNVHFAITTEKTLERDSGTGNEVVRRFGNAIMDLRYHTLQDIPYFWLLLYKYS